MNAPGDLQALHKLVCDQYAALRAEGGCADSPYIPFFINTMSALDRAKDVSPTIVVLREDGTHGTIDLVELFRGMGYMA